MYKLWMEWSLAVVCWRSIWGRILWLQAKLKIVVWLVYTWFNRWSTHLWKIEWCGHSSQGKPFGVQLKLVHGQPVVIDITLHIKNYQLEYHCKYDMISLSRRLGEIIVVLKRLLRHCIVCTFWAFCKGNFWYLCQYIGPFEVPEGPQIPCIELS